MNFKLIASNLKRFCFAKPSTYSLVRAVKEAVLTTTKWFISQMWNDADWDIKRNNPWTKQFGPLGFPYLKNGSNGVSAVDLKFLYRGHCIDRADLGNYTYGYFGTVIGFSDTILYMGGGFVEAFTYGTGFVKVFISPLYGDSQASHDMIEKGINRYQSEHSGITPYRSQIFNLPSYPSNHSLIF
jgi:hypothetical protein